MTQSIAAASLARRPGAAIELGASSTYRVLSTPQQGSSKWPTKRFYIGGFFIQPWVYPALSDHVTSASDAAAVSTTLTTFKVLSKS